VRTRTPRIIGRANPRRGLIALWWCLAAAGCAELPNATTENAIATARPAAAATTPDEPPAATGPQPAPPVSTAETSPRGSGPPLAAPAAPATEGSDAAPALSASSVASPTSAETLDFTSLATRLRKTKAISLLTKVAVKNESDDLLERFRAYHTQHGTATLADLRRAYDLLLGELHSLLQDTDPPLARDIDRSRAAIWEILADPRKFSASHLMTGA
jgi:hypothetical protein